MTKNITFDVNAIFEEIVEAGRAQGITTHEAYRDLVEEVIYEHESDAEISDDSNIQLRVEDLTKRFDEYIERLKG